MLNKISIIFFQFMPVFRVWETGNRSRETGYRGRDKEQIHETGDRGQIHETGDRGRDKEQIHETGDRGHETRNRYMRQGTEDGRQGTDT